MGLRSYRDAVAFITGGASGIGLAIGRELIARGAARVVLADVRGEAADVAARELGEKARSVAFDVRDRDAFARAAAEVFERDGRLDYFFNNAGTGVFGVTERHKPEDWTLTLEVNLFGVVNGVQAVYPRMLAQGFGHVVNTASIAGLIPTPLLAAYSTSKHAVVGLSRAMRLEAERRGVRVSALCPGAVKTPLLSGGAFGAVRGDVEIPKEKIEQWWGRIRPIEADELARVALDDLAKNREIVVVPHWLGRGAWLYRAFPSLERRMLRKDLAWSAALVPELFDEKPRASS